MSVCFALGHFILADCANEFLLIAPIKRVMLVQAFVINNLFTAIVDALELGVLACHDMIFELIKFQDRFAFLVEAFELQLRHVVSHSDADLSKVVKIIAFTVRTLTTILQSFKASLTN